MSEWWWKIHYGLLIKKYHTAIENLREFPTEIVNWFIGLFILLFMSYHKAEQWEAVPSNLVWYIKVCLHYHWVPFWSPSLNCPNRPLSLQFGSERSQSTQPGFISDTNQKICFWSAPDVLQPLTGIKVHRIKLQLTQTKIPCSKHSLDIGTITYFILQIQSYCVTRFTFTETKPHTPTSSY